MLFKIIRLKERFVRKLFFIFYSGKKDGNYIIELIGPPASGKTYLKSNIIKSHKLIDADSIKAFSMRLVNLSHNEYEKIYRFYHDSIQKIQLSNLFEKIIKIIDTDLISRSMKYNIINDEGLFHHFHDFWFKNQIEHNFIRNRVFIFIIPSTEKIIENIKKREQEDGHIWSGHKGLDHASLTQLCEQQRKSYLDLYYKLHEIGSNCILLEDSYRMEDALHFINETLN